MISRSLRSLTGKPFQCNPFASKVPSALTPSRSLSSFRFQLVCDERKFSRTGTTARNAIMPCGLSLPAEILACRSRSTILSSTFIRSASTSDKSLSTSSPIEPPRPVTSSKTSSPSPSSSASNTPDLDDENASGTTSLKEAGRLLSLAKPEAKVLAGAIGLLFISSGVTMSVPFSMGKIIDYITASLSGAVTSSGYSLPFIFGALCGLFAVGALANFGRVVLMRMAGERIVMKLRKDIFGSIMNQDIEFFDKNRSGELISRLSADTTIVGKSITQNISDGLRSTVSGIVGIGMMAYMNIQLTLIMMTIVPPVALAAVWYGRIVRRLSKQTLDAVSETTKVAEEKVNNVRTVRAFSQEAKETALYGDKAKEVYNISVQEGYANGFFFGGMGFAGNIVVLAILYYGGSMVSTGAISIGELTSFFLYTAYVGTSLIGLSGFYSELMKGLGASSRLFVLLDEKGHIEQIKGNLIKLDSVEGRIEFRHVGFSYPTRPDIPIFNDLSFTVDPGTNVAIVGKSGSGKSSIAQLLLRFYDPLKGHVLIDGYDLKCLDPTSLRTDVLSFVSQEPALFAATIRENIAYGRPDATEEEIYRAADQANALGFILSFPAGFDTYVGEKGVAISGGQKQRIAIARALVKDPKILVLDEATSALDASSEHLVQDSLSKIVEGRTVITIAHRLSTIMMSDVVVMIEGGRVVEAGPYDELIERKDGKFRALVEAQLQE